MGNKKISSFKVCVVQLTQNSLGLVVVLRGVQYSIRLL